MFYPNAGSMNEIHQTPLDSPSSMTQSTAPTSHKGRKRRRPQDEIESTEGEGLSAARARLRVAPQPLYSSQNEAKDADEGNPNPATSRPHGGSQPLYLAKNQVEDTDEKESKSPTSGPSRAALQPLYTSVNPHAIYPHLIRPPHEKYQSMDRETLFHQKCQKAQIKGHPHIYEPLPQGLQLHEIITQYPNHLHGPLLLEIAEFWTPKEISNAVGPEFLRSNTIVKRISAAKAEWDGGRKQGKAQVRALECENQQDTPQADLTTSESSIASSSAAAHLTVVESDASRRTRESQEAALAKDPNFFMRIEKKRLSSRQSSRKSALGIFAG